jgi:hypothetical protein
VSRTPAATAGKGKFADALNRGYRRITEELPLDAFSTSPNLATSLKPVEAMFRYFDLSNEQLRITRSLTARQ